MDLVIGLMLGVGLALVATHRRGSPIIERYYHADQKFYERWQAYRKLERLIESDDGHPLESESTKSETTGQS